jgi:hypothetical protein
MGPALSANNIISKYEMVGEKGLARKGSQGRKGWKGMVRRGWRAAYTQEAGATPHESAVSRKLHDGSVVSLERFM